MIAVKMNFLDYLAIRGRPSINEVSGHFDIKLNELQNVPLEPSVKKKSIASVIIPT